MHYNAIDLTGRRFGRLEVIKLDEKRRNGCIAWECQCDCGNVKIVASGSLVRKSGGTLSCGCIAIEATVSRSKTHGKTKDPRFYIWIGMRARCRNPTNKDFENYGGRGIKVCERWDKSFESFIEDMGDRPSLEHSIDRIQNHGNYELGNCRWAIPIVQCNNTRYNKVVELEGMSLTYAEWDRKKGFRLGTVSHRIRLGWSPQDAINRELRFQKKAGASV